MKNKKEFCISTVRGILQQKKIAYKEITANSGSIYFQLFLETSAPCLRLADHHHGKNKPSATFYWIVGENAKNKQVKKRLEHLIDNIIKRSKIGKTVEAIKQLESVNE